MQIFGLVSLLLVVALGVWWTAESTKTHTSSEEVMEGEVEETRYQDAINSAEEAVKKIEGSVSLSSRSVFVADGVSVPDDTRILDLSGKGLSGSLKAEVRELKSLKELNISNNNFTGLPAEVGQLSQLEILNLSNNPLTGLPYELGNLKKLKTLDLRGTQFAKQDLEVIKTGLSSDVKILID
ncbi:leucine-rich repeat domain-containing protein [Candidatus Kaiserbacteria bacterium]|nr:leucine-rich repeat domain-containing protein [Candidatus Kaiserbacteria bacterium]